jgi:hypothetical protein
VRPALALLALATVAGSARADVGPLLPFAKNASATHQIEVAEEFAEYVCVVHRYGWADGARAEYNEASYEKLAPGRPLVLRLTRTEIFSVMLVPRSVAAAYPTARELAGAVSGDRLAGVEEYRFDSRETVPSWAGDEITITYRVQRKSSGDGLELVRTSRNPLWQWYAVAGLVTVAIVTGGLWLIRRLQPRPTAAAN